MSLMGASYFNSSGGTAYSFDNIESAITAYRNLSVFTTGFIVESTPEALTVYSPPYDRTDSMSLLWAWWGMLRRHPQRIVSWSVRPCLGVSVMSVVFTFFILLEESVHSMFCGQR